MTVDPEEKRVLAIVRGYLDALAAGDWAEACTLLAPSVRRDLAALTADEGKVGEGAEALAALLASRDQQALAAELGDVELGPVRVDGDRAEVEIATPESPICLRKAEGKWHITQLRFARGARAAARLEAIEPL